MVITDRSSAADGEWRLSAGRFTCTATTTSSYIRGRGEKLRGAEARKVSIAAEMNSRYEQQLTAPYQYLEQTPGKDLRTQHINAFNSIINAPPSVVQHVVELVKKLHTASLLLDDIEDSAELRRGKPAAHNIFGVPRTINSANFVMLEAIYEATQKLGSDVAPILYEELFALHRGQGLDLYWRDAHVCPTEDEYLDMVHNKTGGLYRLAVRLLQHFGASDIDLVPLANLFGIVYQIQDDFLGLSTHNNQKGFCEDITEGKYSFPVVHFFSQDEGETPSSSRLELEHILRLHTSDVKLKEHALRILERSGSLDYLCNVLRDYVDKAKQEIAKLELEDSTPLYKLLEKLVFII